MPKVALTQAQRERNAVRDACKKLLDAMNARRGLLRMSKEEFSRQIGVSPTTWWRWNCEGLAGAEFQNVLTAAMRAGVKISFE